MMNTPQELEREFREICATKFWKAYCLELQTAKGLILRKLMRGSEISKTITNGECWQKLIDQIERVIGMPDKIINQSDTDNPQ